MMPKHARELAALNGAAGDVLSFRASKLTYLLGLLVSPVLIATLFVGAEVWGSEQLIDAASFRNGAQFLGTPDLYSLEAYVAAQKQELPDAQAYRMFLRPPWYAAAAVWLADMPYGNAMTAWRMAMAAFALLFIAAWPDRLQAALAVLWSVPLLSAMLQGQDDTVVLAALAVCLLFLRHEKDVPAGVALAFCAIKPHFFLFVPIVLIAARRGRVALGAAVGLGVQVVVSFLVQGAAWPMEFVQAMIEGTSDGATNGVSSFYLVKGLGSNVELAAAILLTLLGGMYVWKIARDGTIACSLCAAFAVAVVTSPHAFLQDMLLAAPLALLALDGGDVWARRTALFFLSSAWAIAYLIVANGPSVSIAATLLAVLPASGLIFLTTRPMRS